MRAKRISVFLVMIITAFSLCLGDIAIPKVHAEDGLRDADKIALIVYYVDDSVGDGDSNKIKELRSFTMAELYDIALKEGGGTYKKYTYSSFNTYPTARYIKNATGPTVRSIITEALKYNDSLPNELTSIGDDNLIEIKSGTDGITERFTKFQLIDEPRYYFPQYTIERAKEGRAPVPEAYLDKTVVPAIISLTEMRQNSDVVLTKYDDPDVGRLLIGQTVPNEQNHSAYNKGMTGGTRMSKPGEIIIHSGAQSKWKSIKSANKGATSLWVGEYITFDREDNGEPNKAGNRHWIYYTIDGKNPTRESEMYNYNNYYYGTSDEKINRVKTKQDNETINIRVRVCGYGRPDSDVTDISVNVKAVKATSLKSVVSKNYNTIGIEWSKNADASGYELYRSTKPQEGYTLIKNITDSNITYCTNTSRATGTRYYYKIRPYITTIDCHTGEKNIIYGPYSGYKSATPVPSTTSISYIKGGTRKVSLKWKKVSGATGYKIYRSTKKSSGYKAIKTITKGSTVSYTNKSLRKGKTYYYKIKAYRKVGSKYYYSSYSIVRSARAK